MDPDLVKKPKHWNLKMISQFMAFFGLISTFFDLLTIFKQYVDFQGVKRYIFIDELGLKFFFSFFIIWIFIRMIL